jgi:L-methionine (R)-S-oxide reductase
MDYARALTEIRSILDDAPALAQAAQRVVERLRAGFPHYSWVGIYWVRGRDLVLGPWAGPEATQHTRIPIGAGVCGAAAASGRTEVVPDVTRDPRYLACFPSTRSEIVVPIRSGDQVLGEIDIDSTAPAAFSRADQEFLEAVAGLLAARAPARAGTPASSAPPGASPRPPEPEGRP